MPRPRTRRAPGIRFPVVSGGWARQEGPAPWGRGLEPFQTVPCWVRKVRATLADRPPFLSSAQASARRVVQSIKEITSSPVWHVAMGRASSRAPWCLLDRHGLGRDRSREPIHRPESGRGCPPRPQARSYRRVAGFSL